MNLAFCISLFLYINTYILNVEKFYLLSFALQSMSTYMGCLQVTLRTQYNVYRCTFEIPNSQIFSQRGLNTEYIEQPAPLLLNANAIYDCIHLPIHIFCRIKTTLFQTGALTTTKTGDSYAGIIVLSSKTGSNSIAISLNKIIYPIGNATIFHNIKKLDLEK